MLLMAALRAAARSFNACRLAEVEEFEHKQKEVEAVCSPIMTRMYQAGDGEGEGSMPGGMGGMPGGMGGMGGGMGGMGGGMGGMGGGGMGGGGFGGGF
jgi:L1 cell adhesion molecule like protein